MSNLEKFIHADSQLPLLVRIGLVHTQFETIHPFLDGNGRLGRLLITLMLLAENALGEPMLYLSLYLKTHRETYYDLLQRVRLNSDWEGWLAFFLTGLEQTADQAASTARSLFLLLERDRQSIEQLGRPAASALRVHQYLQTNPIISVARASESLSISKPTTGKSIDHLVDLKILEEITGRQRDRLFVYKKYMDALAEGTEPLG
jgi:Fic family protein